MLCKKAAAGAVSVRIGQNVHGGGAVVDNDGLGGLAHGYHGKLFGKVHGYALSLFKGTVRIALQIRLRHVLQLGEGMSFPDVYTGGHRRQLVEGQLPGVQQTADDLFRQFGQIDDADVRPVVIHIVDHAVHAGLFQCILIAVFLVLLEHFQESVLCKGIPLGGNAEMHRCNGAAGFAVQALDPLLLFQQRDCIAQKLLALRRKLHAPVAADEEFDTQFLLQFPHGGGNAGLGQEQLVGGLVDRTAFGDLHHICQLLKGHWIVSFLQNS